VSAAPGSAAAKMEALNKALFEWMKTQMKDHALSIWKDGLLVSLFLLNLQGCSPL
jgi:hypothetical protein